MQGLTICQQTVAALQQVIMLTHPCLLILMPSGGGLMAASC
jgi:hypothetical protein